MVYPHSHLNHHTGNVKKLKIRIPGFAKRRKGKAGGGKKIAGLNDFGI
jgi:hypothetical protein